MDLAKSEPANDEDVSPDRLQTKDEVIRTLSNGLLNIYEKDLLRVKENLNDLILRQTKIQNSLSDECYAFSSNQLTDTDQMMQKLRIYKEKLINIKKQMMNIHYRTRNLKKRSTALQEFKLKEREDKLLRRKHEESLIGASTSTKE